MADTTVRLWHVGSYAYSWEEAGTEPRRYATYALQLGEDPERNERPE
ncbi:MAG: hypothetical protein ACRD1H_01800 [Vicinamibacterales bacterium]